MNGFFQPPSDTHRQKNWGKRLRPLAGGLVLLGLLYASTVLGTNKPVDFDSNRNKLISYVLKEELSRNHYSHKPMDDALSQAAFELFLKQLDAQKRFLLQKDVDRLQPFATRIDDEINRGVLELPNLATGIMSQRITLVRTMVKDLLATPLDFKLQEQLETDPDKLAFCRTEAELRERWRKILKLQVLTRFLNLQEEQPTDSPEQPKAPVKTDGELLKEARAKVQKSYDQFFSRMQDEENQDLSDRYFNAVTRAFDPHTNYLPPTQKEDFDISMRGSLEGIGATLREEDGYIKVIQIIPGSAAGRQGRLQAEDTILKVAEGSAEPVDITDMRLRDAVSLIRGKKGTEVRLTVKKPDASISVIPIIRDVVQIEETFVKGITVTDPSSGKTFGYLRIPSFYRDFQGQAQGTASRNVTDDLRAELNKLEQTSISGLMIDLRNNGGGALTDAVASAGLFFDQGPVVQVRNSDGKNQVLADEDPSVSYSGPVVVLVNQFSASASEILAGALQDYRRAVILGSAHTHGKGTVQAMLDLDRALPFRNMDQYKPLGALKITIQKFYRVSGGSTQYRGVVPDIVLPDRLQALKSGEQYIEYSLPWDTVNATTFVPWRNPPPDLSWLQNRSHQRTEKDLQWEEVAREAARAKAKSENTLQSLNIDKIRQERKIEKAVISEWEKVFPHAGQTDNQDPDKPATPLNEKEKETKMIEEVQRDPLTKEAMAVLNDLVVGMPAPLGATAINAGRGK